MTQVSEVTEKRSSRAWSIQWVGATTQSAALRPAWTRVLYWLSQGVGSRPCGRQAEAQLRTSLWATRSLGMLTGEAAEAELVGVEEVGLEGLGEVEEKLLGGGVGEAVGLHPLERGVGGGVEKAVTVPCGHGRAPVEVRGRGEAAEADESDGVVAIEKTFRKLFGVCPDSADGVRG